jgi:60 kDa SS-A/Ro ribonucleoprotein
MGNKVLFGGQRSIPRGVQPVNTVNEAGGAAYAFTPEHALAQYALTGTFNRTFYASDEEQLKKAMEFASKCSPTFVAQTAVYARENGYMKDMPAFLLAYLTGKKETALMKAVFPRVVDSPKMVRNFVQMIRSGQVGRKSFGTAPKKLVHKYLDQLSDDALFRADVGNAPTLQDIIKMVRPAPKTKERAALYGYLIDKKRASFGGEQFEIAPHLVEVAQEYEIFKKQLLAATGDSEKNRLVPPNVPFLLLTALPLTKEHWKVIAQRATWTQIRMNLNTFARHDVFKDSEIVKILADKLADKEQIRRARAMPYQLFAAHQYLGEEVPAKLRNAVIDAADIAIDNVPKIEGHVVVCPDVSGSMDSPITGSRKGSTSKISCRQVAALCAAAVLRQNGEATILAFSDDVMDIRHLKLNPRDSVLTNANKLASLPSGGTNCSAPLRLMNAKLMKADLVWFVSDNMSWADSARSYYGGQSATGMMAEFTVLKNRSPKARMVLHDIQPNASTQGHEREDIMNVGGFSDNVFDVVAGFAKGQDAKTLVDTIKSVSLYPETVSTTAA